MRPNLFWLTDAQWAIIEPRLPTNVRGKEQVYDRRVIRGIVHVLKSGYRWRDCPPEYGPHTTIYSRFVRWSERGFFQRLDNGVSVVREKIDRPIEHWTSHHSAGRRFVFDDA